MLLKRENMLQNIELKWIEQWTLLWITFHSKPVPRKGSTYYVRCNRMGAKSEIHFAMTGPGIPNPLSTRPRTERWRSRNKINKSSIISNVSHFLRLFGPYAWPQRCQWQVSNYFILRHIIKHVTRPDCFTFHSEFSHLFTSRESERFVSFVHTLCTFM